MNELDIRNLRFADFAHAFNKTRQSASDVIEREEDGPAVIPTLAKKITSELAEVMAPQQPQQRQNADNKQCASRHFLATFHHQYSESPGSL